MSTDAASQAQQKQREFMSLLPLTSAIAGLPHAEHGKYFNDGQMEARATALKNAYRYARAMVLEIAQD
ncbi:MAG: hypothetical protein K1X57_05655 [Gemmataceae bacterium]|nr:hypothetical protein [Gemmataceae bacterium]